MNEPCLLSLVDLHALASDALAAANTSRANAACVADALVAADADGIGSHGVSRVPAYADQAASGKVDGHAVPRLESPRPAVVLVDACAGFAYPAIRIGLERGAEICREQGIALVAIGHSHHSGASSCHVEPVARAGLVVLGFSNTPSGIAPWGGRRGLFGTNPVAFACPRAGDDPLVVDLSLSVVARGKVMMAAKQGQPIPLGWALDADGQPTTDAGAALNGGTMVPIGEAKGAALALVVELLTAGLTGSNFGYEASSFFTAQGPSPGIAQSFLLVDPGFAPGAGFVVRAEAMLAEILGQPGTRLPGERRLAARERSRRDGVSVPAALYDDLRQRAGRA